jgi:hypothetical protein
MIRLFRAFTILALAGSLVFDFYSGRDINIIYLFALIAVLFT